MIRGNQLTLKGILNLLLVFCFLRFGLVMTAGYSVFSLPNVVLAGAGVVAVYVFLSKQYTGQLLQANMGFLGCNILLVFFIREVTTRSFYISTASNYINQLIILGLLWGFYLCLRMQTVQTQRRMVMLYLMTVVVSSIYTLYVALNGEDGVIRNTASGGYDARFAFAYGGFDFIYALVLVYGALFVVLTEGGKRIKSGVRICVWIVLLLIMVTIVVSGFSTAFVLVLLFTILNLPQKRSVKTGGVLVLLFLIFVIPEQIAGLIESIPFMPELTSSRIREMLLSFSGRGTSDYISGDGQRLDRIWWSIRAFAEHPLIGVFGSDGSEPLGYHTEWIEQLARYGIFTSIFNTAFWAKTYQIMVGATQSTATTKKCTKNVFVLYFILGFLNPISMVITAAPLFLLCPFAEKLLLGKTNLGAANRQGQLDKVSCN